MGLITLQDVSLTYGDRALLRGVSMIVGGTDRIGLLGANGAGKSTLTRILAGIEEPDAGLRTVRRDLRIGYLEQEPVFDPGRSIAEIVHDGMAERVVTLRELSRVHEELATATGASIEKLLVEQSRLDELLESQGGHDVEHRVEAMIHNLGLVGVDQTWGDLSGGERRRVALARLLLSAPELLILDEPTNHLDAEVTDWLEDWLLQSRTPLVLVTHDRYFLDRLVNRTIEIEHGVLHEYDGAYTEFITARATRLEQEQAAESTRANLLRRETEWMRRGPPARTTKSKARIAQFHDLVDAAPEKAGRGLAFALPCGPRLGEKVLRFSGVSAGYDGNMLFEGLDLEIGARTRIGIVGPNGAGKSTLLKLCTGELEPVAGTVERGSTVKFAAIDQKRSDLDETKTVLEEVSGNNDYVHVDGKMVRVESFLEQFLFPGAMKHARIETLSGGERNRVLLAKLLCADGNVILLDEPTNDLDLMTLRALEEAICAFPGVVLVVSHDRFFLDRVATRILRIDGAGGHRVHEGDLSLLLEKMAAERQAATSSRTTARKASKATESKQKVRKLSSRERNELEKLPDEIATAEEELTRLAARLEDPALWQGAGSEVQAVTDAHASVKVHVDKLYARWEELEAVREGS